MAMPINIIGPETRPMGMEVSPSSKKSSNKMYIHPIMKPARPKRGGTHHVVVRAGMEVVLHSLAENGESYCKTPKAEW